MTKQNHRTAGRENMEDIFKTIGNENLKRRLFFISEIDKMKTVMRRTLLTDGSRRENDAEHSWHLGVMAFILEEYAKEPFCMERVLKMVLIHDLVEVYAGDTFAFDREANLQKEEKEKAAAEKLFSILPADQGKELREIWEEFDAMNTPDSRYAAALDRLQPFIHNLLTNGHTWVLGNVKVSQVMERSGSVMEILPELRPWMEEQISLAVKKGWIKD